MKCLLTGGCGFVGRHFLTYLLDHGHDVTCIDNFASKGSYKLEPHPNLTLHLRDVRDFFRDNNEHYDLIIHLAAIIGGRSVIDGSPLEIAEDLAIDADFFRWLSRLSSKPGKVVYFSSSAAYPISLQQNNAEKKELSEDMIDFSSGLIGVPDMTYGMSKLVGEYLAKIAHQKYGINIVCYRPFSGYGPDQDASYPFTAIIGRVLRGEKPVEVWSDTVRDFVYIDDIVDCVMATMDKVGDGSAINIGSGVGTSFLELAGEMSKILGHDGGVRVLNDKPTGVYSRVADTKLLNELGWKPRVSLAEGIRRVANIERN